MRKTAKGVLSVIAAFLKNPEVKKIEKHRVWNILTALRGPDMPKSIKAKREYTHAIRRNAFPALSERDFAALGVKAQNGRLPEVPARPGKGDHFQTHAHRAVIALEYLTGAKKDPK